MTNWASRNSIVQVKDKSTTPPPPPCMHLDWIELKIESFTSELHNMHKMLTVLSENNN